MTFTLYDTKSQLRQSATLYLWNVSSQKHFSILLFHECCTTQKHFFFLLCANYFCCCESSSFIWRYVISFWTRSQNLLLLNVFWLALKPTILKCIIIIHSTLTRPLNLACLWSIWCIQRDHFTRTVPSSIRLTKLRQLHYGCAMMWCRCWVNSFVKIWFAYIL